MPENRVCQLTFFSFTDATRRMQYGAEQGI